MNTNKENPSTKKHKQIETTASDISVLSEELLLEILCRLGRLKYAIRCKSVSKLWCSLVSTESESHLSRCWRRVNHKKEAELPVTMCIDYEETSLNITTLDFLPCGSNARVLRSHKDLVVCRSDLDRPNDDGRYYVCNPFTRQWAALPERHRAGVVGLIVDDDNRFTVVLVLVACPGWKILALSSGGWEEMDDSGGWREMFGENRFCKEIVSYNGDLVWIMGTYHNNNVRLYKWNLSGSCSRIPLPPGYKTGCPDRIGACQGRLMAAQLVDDYQKLIVWEFEGREWDMIQESDFSSCRDWLENGRKYSLWIRDMAFLPREGDILYMFVNIWSGSNVSDIHNYIYTYNRKEKRLELIQKFKTTSPLTSLKLLLIAENSWPTLIDS